MSRRDAFCLILLVVFAVVAVSPLLQPGYFWGAHDARHDAYFIFQYDKSVQDGIWFARWGPDWAFGYGYPFWIIYAPLATFVGELFHHFLGLGFEDSVKAVLGLSVLLSGLAMYGFARAWLGRRAGLVAAVAYMVIPYHLVDVYVRAAMAESLALAFLPLALWGFRETVVRPRLAAIIGAAAAYAAIMWCSNLLALIFTPGLAAYVLFLLIWAVPRQARPAPAVDLKPGGGAAGRVLSQIASGRVAALLAPAAAFLLGLGLSAAFFVPALVEQRFINQTQWFGKYYDPFQHFVYFNQLFSPNWGFGISQPGPDDAATGALAYQLGAVPVMCGLFALAIARRFRPIVRREVWFWGLWAAVSIFLTLGPSSAAWRYVPIVPYAQFPWRYLTLAIIPLSILPAALVTRQGLYQIQDGSRAPSRSVTGVGCRFHLELGLDAQASAPPRRLDAAEPEAPHPVSPLGWPPVILAGLLLLGSYPYLRVEMRDPTPEQGPVSMSALMRFQRTSDEMTGVTAWVDPARIPNWSPMADEWVAGRVVRTRVDYGRIPQNRVLAVNSEEMGSAHEEIWYHADDPGQSIVFNRFWYPGWTAYLLDAKHGRPVRQLPLEREAGPLARIVLPVPAGEGYVLLRFEDTPLRAAAKWVTILTLALLGGLILARMALRRGWGAGLMRKKA